MEYDSDEVFDTLEEFCDNLIPLTGTEKQITWALKIRDNMVRNMLLRYVKKQVFVFDIDMVMIEKLKKFVLSKTDAKYWIEHRDWSCISLEKVINETLYFEEKKDEELISDVKLEATVYPENQRTKVVAEIIFDESDNKIRIKSEKDFILIDVVKDMGYSWSGKTWWYKITPYKNDLPDRMAEVGNKLLLAGVPVIIWDDSIRKKAINGEYEKECHRWIIRQGDKKIEFVWDYRSDMLYKKTKRLPHAEWDNGGMLVPARYYREIRDFAKLNEFKLTKKAEDLLIEEEKKEQAIIKTAVKEREKKGQTSNELEDILKSSRDILDDLKDD